MQSPIELSILKPFALFGVVAKLKNKRILLQKKASDSICVLFSAIFI